MALGRPVDGQGPSFALLGPLEVTRQASPVLLRGPRRRALLARLCVSANEVVALETLIDDLWPQNPPENPVNALQAYLSHLRAALGSGRTGRDGVGTTLTRKPGTCSRWGPTDSTSSASSSWPRKGMPRCATAGSRMPPEAAARR